MPPDRNWLYNDQLSTIIDVFGEWTNHDCIGVSLKKVLSTKGLLKIMGYRSIDVLLSNGGLLPIHALLILATLCGDGVGNDLVV